MAVPYGEQLTAFMHVTSLRMNVNIMPLMFSGMAKMKPGHSDRQTDTN
jgi:hypothetical protein